MDCNSIVYDAYYALEKEYQQNPSHKYPKRDQIEDILIKRVIDGIKKHIAYIQPTNLIYIAFDGVAPLAKMSQQRTRRYKSLFMSQIDDKPKIWNTVAITPGTLFSKKLSAAVNREFRNKPQIYGVKKILVSCADEAGEGEHKLFQYMRENPAPLDEVAVYGLDSDLIMLSTLHKIYCKNIHIFREAPEFIKSIRDIPVPSDKILFLDINEFSTYMFEEIATDMSHSKNMTCEYIFICFFLGNDFLPHFPALNIRTHGIQILLDTYKARVKENPGFALIDPTNNEINWENVKLFLCDIAKNERNYIIQELDERKKWDKRYWSETTDEDKANILDNVPVIYRQEEKYIDPNIPKWQSRYYNILFDTQPESNIQSHIDIDNICQNYFEGLEWTYKYYTKGCPDWRWKYNYTYPPLIEDLLQYLRTKQITPVYEFVSNKAQMPFTTYQQLAYVLPYRYLNLLPVKYCENLKTNYKEYYPERWVFQWAYCRYFWEAHPVLKEMGIEILGKI